MLYGIVVVACLLSYVVSESEALRAGAVHALHAVLKMSTVRDDSIARLLGRITRGKSQAGIIADPSYASHVSSDAQLYVAELCVLYMCEL